MKDRTFLEVTVLAADGVGFCVAMDWMRSGVFEAEKRVIAIASIIFFFLLFHCFNYLGSKLKQVSIFVRPQPTEDSIKCLINF